jgi:phosphonate transport system substrate-binding protein
MYSIGQPLSRRAFFGLAGVTALGLGLGLTGCTSASGSSATGSTSSSSGSATSLDKITMVWMPNQSSAEYDAGREEFGKKVEEYAGVPVELMATTDYNVTVEALASGKAQLALIGAEGLIEAQKKNDAVLPLVTTSDKNGTLDGAKYYSRICVPADEMDTYKDSSSSTGYSIANIKGKRMSFVSQSSTSGFKVPCNAIMKQFPDEVTSTDQLTVPGFFSEVMFGGSHPGSAINLLQGDADVAAFDDTATDMYMVVPDGERDEVNSAGSIYEVAADAVQPFDRVVGEKFGIIQSTPVLNACIAYNSAVIPQDVTDNLLEGLTSDNCTNDELLFAPEGAEGTGAVWSREKSAGFIEVENSWYDPIRELQ